MICIKLLKLIKVLIDTWWNVNKGTDLDRYGDNGFNRYMVECEFLYIKQL